MPELIPAVPRTPGLMMTRCDYCGKPFITTADDDERTCDPCLRDLLGDDPEYADA